MGKPRQTNRLGRRVRSFVIVLGLLGFALWPAAASAAAPVAVDESVQIANPTTVPLEATTSGTTEMTFAIASNPTRGSLGQISSPTCQPTQTGGTDCKATVTPAKPCRAEIVLGLHLRGRAGRPGNRRENV